MAFPIYRYDRVDTVFPEIELLLEIVTEFDHGGEGPPHFAAEANKRTNVAFLE